MSEDKQNHLDDSFLLVKLKFIIYRNAVLCQPLSYMFIPRKYMFPSSFAIDGIVYL